MRRSYHHMDANSSHVSRYSQMVRHAAAETPAEIAERMARAAAILKDPLGYWREFSSEPRSVTSGDPLGVKPPSIRRAHVPDYQ